MWKPRFTRRAPRTASSEAAPWGRLTTVAVTAALAAGTFQLALGAHLRTQDEGVRLDRMPPVEILAGLPELPRRLAADLLWVRAIQSYGYHRQTDLDFRPMGTHMDAVTLVDPGFETAYDFGGLVLAQEGGDPKQGLRLLARGMANLPDSWLLPFETGFIYYVVLGDVNRAAGYFDHAASLPGAPAYVKHFAAYSYARAGRRDMARCFWSAILKEADREEIRRLATEALRRLDREEESEHRRHAVSLGGTPGGTSA